MLSKATVKENILAYLFLILVCFIFGFIVAILLNFSTLLGLLFITLTAGFFNYSGKSLVEEGLFNEKYWKKVFLAFIPAIIVIDGLIWMNVDWYDFIATAPYYFLFTIGLVRNHSQRVIKHVVELLKDIEPGYNNLTNEEIREQIKAIKECGYEWVERKNTAGFKHTETGLYLKIKGLHRYKPEEIKKVYTEVWSRQDPKQVRKREANHQRMMERILNRDNEES